MGTGAAFATVITAGAQAAVVVVVVTRRIRPPVDANWRRTIRLDTIFLAYTARFGLSATCTAPPPIRAPPHAQAHNFAKAIRTDISSLFRCRRLRGPGSRSQHFESRYPTKAETNR